MNLSSTRTLESLKPVLKDPKASGPDPAYWVFNQIGGKWENITVISSGDYNKEYPKTFGHYHTASEDPETYHLIEGKGVLVMQKKLFRGDEWVKNEVEEVVLIKAQPGEQIIITPEWGHSWSNIGESALISFDDWRAGHSPEDYRIMEELKGLAYYLVNEDGEVKTVPNPSYNNLPSPQWLSSAEFADKFSKH